MIRIIHISDLHLESGSPRLAKKQLLESLINDIKNHTNDSTILFFTGDIIDKGGEAFEDAADAFNVAEKLFISKITSIIPQLKNRIFITPGNHDVQRKYIDPISVAGLDASLRDESSLSVFIEQNKHSSNHLHRLAHYKKWETEFFKDYPIASLSNFQCTFQLQIGEHKVGVTSVNSAWLCKDNLDKENLLIGKQQIESSLTLIQDCDVKLILTHHPFEFLRPYDREAIKPLVYRNYDALFTGHVHELGSSYTQDLNGELFISIANSTIADEPIERKFINGYTIIDLHPGSKILAEYRVYVEHLSVFVPNTLIGADNGMKTFRILRDDQLQKFEENKAIVDSIESRYCDRLNEHIIMANGTTPTKPTIDSLFVEPTLLNFPQGGAGDDEVEEYKIDGILSSGLNYLICGPKESGKTILLDKMFLESVRRFNVFNKIPVLVKFHDLKKHDLKQIIREFIGVSKPRFKEFCCGNNIILFIDDLSFGEKHQNQVDDIKSFLKEHPHIQLVCTETQVMDSIMPTGYLPHNDVFNFNAVFIQNFNSQQIKKLITNWFAGREVDLEESMQRLIKSFVDFGLPKTPLSVTLFLWIFEKQEKRPINNSVLVELFVENLLEKTNVTNIYHEIFDFKNKQRLLAFVAKHMYSTGDPDNSYAIDYVTLLDYVKSYLSSRFTGQPQKVLEDFITRGILSFEGINLVKFRTAFLFHYFLALYIDYDKTFRSWVFSDDNYLDFIEEICYHTGLKRDDVEVLTFTQQKLQHAFGEFNEDIIQNHEKLDAVLNSGGTNSITSAIDPSLTQQKIPQERLDQIYDEQLSQIPVQTGIQKKDASKGGEKVNHDKILKLAATVLKNSEDVDDLETKKSAYKHTLTSSISFLIQYRDALLSYYKNNKKRPDNFPRNIDFGFFIKILPLIHQVVVYEWMGTQKLRPVIIEKIKEDQLSPTTSELEKFLSIFIYGDIKGSDYPQIIQRFVKEAKHKYIKDLSCLKLLSYYHLRNNNKELDDFYLKLIAEIKVDLGLLDKRQKSQFKDQLKENRGRKNN